MTAVDVIWVGEDGAEVRLYTWRLEGAKAVCSSLLAQEDADMCGIRTAEGRAAFPNEGARFLEAVLQTYRGAVRARPVGAPQPGDAEAGGQAGAETAGRGGGVNAAQATAAPAPAPLDPGTPAAAAG
jgi:hypothetical protein